MIRDLDSVYFMALTCVECCFMCLSQVEPNSRMLALLTLAKSLSIYFLDPPGGLGRGRFRGRVEDVGFGRFADKAESLTKRSVRV